MNDVKLSGEWTVVLNDLPPMPVSIDVPSDATEVLNNLFWSKLADEHDRLPMSITVPQFSEIKIDHGKRAITARFFVAV
ncbi:MAG: hypothetical protein AAB871_01345 [Patescibacteria group bacterium]